MNKILILGADGNLGQQLHQEFSSIKSNQVYPFTKNDLDLLDFDSILPKISALKPDLIINATAYNDVDKCEEDREAFRLAQKINGEALRYLAQAALSNHSVLIHYSTDYVFGADNCSDDSCAEEYFLNFKEQGGFLESDEYAPVNKYGFTKAQGELELRQMANKKLKYYIIRTSKLFGPRGSALESKKSFFDLMLDLAKDRDSLSVVNEELSCFTYTVDLAQQSHFLVKNKKDYGIYHIRNADPAIWYDAARELFRLQESRIKINPVTTDKFPRPAKRPKYSVLANSKLPQLRSWKEALSDYLKTIN